MASRVLVAEEMLALLAETSASVDATLDYEHALTRAAGAAVPRFADWCAIDVVQEDGSLRQVTSGELGPDEDALLSRLRGDDRAGIARPGPRVHIVAPLVARDRTIGAITFLLTAPGREYGEGDVDLANELARRLALAVDNARLYEAIERSSLRAAFLAEAGASAGSTLDFERVLAAAARAAVPRFADWCAVDIVQPDGTLRQITSELEDPGKQAFLMDLRRRYRETHGASAGVMRVIETGEPELRRDVRGRSEITLDRGERSEFSRLAPQSYMLVPLMAHGRTLGAMTFLSTTEGRLYGQEDLELAHELARRLALAVDNARLYSEAERATERLGFLADAGHVLSETLDLEKTLERLAGIAVPRLADWCRVYLVEPDGAIRLVGESHRDPEKLTLSRELERRYPVESTAPTGVALAVRTGEAQLVRDVPDEELAAVARGEGHLRLLRALSIRSRLVVPIAGRDAVLGAITLIDTERRFDYEDLNLAEELARRAGSAIENARLHAAVSDAAARSQESLGLLVDTVRDYAIFQLDAGGCIASWNQGAARIKGYRAAEIIGQHFSRFYTPEDLARDRPAEVLRIAAEEGRFEDEGWRVRKDGSRFWASVLVTALRDEGGELRGFLKVTRDMTARKRAEEELRRSNEELERYAYVASHDLSEPLRAIAGFSSLLARRFGETLGEEGGGFVEEIQAGVLRMRALIDDLLTFSRLDRAARDLEPVATAEVVTEVVRSLPGGAQHVAVADELPVVRGARSSLGQLFQNLIGNALKFGGDAPLRVVVSCECVDGDWRFSVRDNGIGIAREHHERIFEAFQRLHTRGEYQGTGIGLAICRKVVELHGGRIWVEPVPGGGSDFRFTLPVS